MMAMTPLDFVEEKFLDQGTFGKVFEATFTKSNQRVAIKKLAVNLNNEESVRQEAKILKSINHPQVLSIFGVVDNLAVGELWIVTELLNGGSLRPYCTGRERLDGMRKVEIGWNCWMALSYLHDHVKITHKDIKPENILLHKTPDGCLVAKLCDFGLAKLKETINQTEKTSIAGTVMYYPPEYAEYKRNPQKADVYSLGVTLCELFTNLHFWHYPVDLKRWDDFQIQYMLYEINKSELDNGKIQYGPGAAMLDRCSPENCPGSIKEILRRTVHYCRQERPSAAIVRDVFQAELEENIITALASHAQPATSPNDGVWRWFRQMRGWRDGYLFIPVQKMASLPADNYYMNFSKPKGLALIINNQRYNDDSKYQERTGSKVDFFNMHHLLNTLDYHVRCKMDREGCQMLEDAEDVAASFNRQDSGQYDSCIVVVMCYSENGSFVGVDGELVTSKEFFNIVINKHAALKEKPKLFFIQACRWPIINNITEKDIPKINRMERNAIDALRGQIPNDGDDFFILFSTTPGHYSWMNEEKGSWFIEAICQEFASRAHERLSELYVHVKDRIYDKLTSYHKRCIHLPEMEFQAEKQFYFFPGLDGPTATDRE